MSEETWEDEGGALSDDEDEFPFDDELFTEDDLEDWDELGDIDDYEYYEDERKDF